MQKSVSKVIIFLCASILISSYVSAENNAGFIYSLEQEGRSLRQRHDVQGAVDRFCRMLSIDPQGRTIQENLSVILQHPDLTAAQKSDVLLLEDLLNYIRNLQERIGYLTSKRDYLKDRLIEKSYDREGLFEDLVNIKNNVSRSQEVFSYQGQLSYNRDNPLAIMNSLLTEEKAALSLRVRSLEDQYDWLKEISKNGKRTPPHFFPSKTLPNSLSFESTIEAEIQEDAAPVWEEAGGDQIFSEPGAEGFKKEMGLLYVQLDQLEERVGKEDSKIEALASQVVDLSLKLSETEMLLNEKAEAVASLRTNLTDVEQRFMLGQRIIQEKDAEIRSLREDLQLARLDAETGQEIPDDGSASKNRHLAELESFLKIYRESLAQSRKEIQEKVIYLERTKKELAALRLQTSAGNKIAGVRTPKSGSFSRSSSIKPSNADGQERRLNNIVESKDEKLIELSGILEIYKDKLGAETRTIKKKAEDINALEQQLESVKNELLEKNEELLKTQHNLRDLESRLSSMKNELLRMQNRSEQGGSEG